VSGAAVPSVERRAITTARLVLEPASVVHGPAMYAAISASIDHLRPWLAWAAKSQFEDTLTYLSGAEELWLAGSAYSFAIHADGALVGDIACRRTFNNAGNEANIGYWIAASVAGRGYGTEAAAAVVQFGFATLGLARQEIRCQVENIASARVAEKIGMQREGLLRNGVHDGADAYLYGMTSQDPRPAVLVPGARRRA
jgi:RimJ/RimL family protein N-acetyltransferase